MDRHELVSGIERFLPSCEQEESDKKLILDFLKNNEDAFLRSNQAAHMTASAWVLNRSHTKVVMVYHKIYDSWSWTGGHADGEADLLNVALREVTEETGLKSVHPVSDEIYSLEILTVDGHEKNGHYVSSHLHMNITYLLEADENEVLKVCENENSDVAWFSLDDALKASSEKWFIERIYKKLNNKLNTVI